MDQININDHCIIPIQDDDYLDSPAQPNEQFVYVIKRKGFKEPINKDKIYKRVLYLVEYPYRLFGIDVENLCQNIISKLEPNITTQSIDEFTAEQSISMVIEHLDYSILASRIAVNNHHKKTRNSFRDKMEDLYMRKDIHGLTCPLISDSYYKFVLKNQRIIEEHIDYERDYLIDYFGFKTLEKSYLMKVNSTVIERPQDMFMRMAIFIYMTNDYFNEANLKNIFNTYDLFSNKLICQASPTMFNSGGTRPQLFSCHDEDAPIRTKSGWVPIRDINVGDYVMTHNLHYKKVSQVHKNPLGNRGVYKISSTDDMNPIKPFMTTENHKFYVFNSIDEKFVWMSAENIFRTKQICLPLESPIELVQCAHDQEPIYGCDQSSLTIHSKTMDSIKNYKEYKDGWRKAVIELGGLNIDHCYKTMNVEIGCQYTYVELDIMKHKLYTKNYNIELVPYDKPFVYTLGVEDDHSYVVGGLVAENCFLLGTHDSQDGINKTFCDMGKISKWAGGLGVHVSSYRATGSMIRTTNGPASGLVPIMKTLNSCVCLYNQGGRRPGHSAMYIEPHHPDIFKFLALKRNHGSDEVRARSLFYALWLSDLFMERVEADADWSLFCPDECPGLNDVWGDEYKRLYLRYEADGKARQVVKTRDIIDAAYDLMKEQGIPYIGFKDTVNRYNMQSNVGIIRSSNLCIEIMLYSDNNNYAVCCLGNLVLPNYVRDSWTKAELAEPEESRRQLNHEFPVHPIIVYLELVNNTRKLVANLDNLLDKNYYPVIETARSSFYTRAIGIGVQGLADVFMKFKIPFESPAAAVLNKKIFEAIYYGAISESNDICYRLYKNARKQIKDHGYVELSPIPHQVLEQYPALYSEHLYQKYHRIYNKAEDLPRTVGAYPAYLENGGSPLANGKFHWELYGAQPSGLFDWESLRLKISLYGVRHSHVTAAMPTASTSQIMGYVESFEPYKSNVYMRKTQAGEFPVMNKFLYNDLRAIKYDMSLAKEYLLINDGSVQNIPNLPADVKALYKTAYEMKMKVIINMARDRQPFVDQSQSMNLFFNRFTYDGHFYKCLMHAWKSGLKTGSYYIRTRAASKAQNISIDPEVEKQIRLSQLTIQEEEPEICIACS